VTGAVLGLILLWIASALLFLIYGSNQADNTVPRGSLIDLDSYCAYRYGENAIAVMGDRWDAYSWSCYRNDVLAGDIDMDEASRTQYPDLPLSVMGDRWDAYSWYCTSE
jgi:hypothetical protein